MCQYHVQKEASCCSGHGCCNTSIRRRFEFIIFFIKRKAILNFFCISVDFNSTHCLMNSEVKLLLDTYMQKRVDETGGYVQPNA